MQAEFEKQISDLNIDWQKKTDELTKDYEGKLSDLRNQKAMSNQEASDKINELTKEIENLNKTIQEKDAKIA